MGKWQKRGIAIAESNQVEKHKLGWKVPSQSGNGTYIVNFENGEPLCTCQFNETTHRKCQHIFAVEYIVLKETKLDGTEVITETVKVTYAQDWSAYNEAQTNEQKHFLCLLKDLCNQIPQPEYNFGRPRLPLSDVIFGLVYKTYSTMSGRRFNTELKQAQQDGLIEKAASYNSAFRYIENSELTPLLKSLIEQSATPLKSVETEFAVDSSGFSTNTYTRWYDHKWGKMRSELNWIKAHLMCGVKTHIVTSCEVTATETADSPQLPKLLDTTTKTFKINEVSADKAYSSKRNLNAIRMADAIPYIPFKSYSKGHQGMHKYSAIWQQMWHFYSFNREAFLQHYHKRSNIETTYSMIKIKFGGSVRSKTPIAQVNEVLCKILCHNICVLIQSIYELNLVPTFETFEAKMAVAPKVLENTDF